MLNIALTIAEQCVRQIYFRSTRIQEWRAERARKAGPPAPRTMVSSEFLRRLSAIGIGPGDSLMVHAGISKIRVVDDVFGQGEVIEGGLAVTNAILRLLRHAIGENGTLLMPAFPKYPNEPAYFSPNNDGSIIPVYDPLQTPSKVGLLSETFRKLPGAVRSEFPIQTVVAQGPKAAWYMDRNVEDGRGLAHGPNSPYGRLVVDRAYVISVGVPLVDYCTVIHAPEEARFDTWPIKDFWRERYYDVVRGGETTRVLVWERTPKYSRGYAEERVRRDLRNAGVLNEGHVGSVEVHGVRANVLFDLFMNANARSTYPFLWPRISGL